MATIATLQSLTISGELHSFEADGPDPTLDLSWLGALHRLRKLDVQGLEDRNDVRTDFLLHLGGGHGSNTDGGGGSGGAGSERSHSRSLPPCLEELLLPSEIQLDGPSVQALAGLRHLTRLSAALDSWGCRALEACPPEPLATTVQQIQLWLVDLLNPASCLPVAASLLAAKPPAELRLILQMGEGTTSQCLLALREVAERVREVASLSITCFGEDKFQVCRAQG